MSDRLPLDAMEPRRLYRIQSRNLVVGVWSPETSGFLGIRTKFGSRYLDTEYHHDTGAPYGTASPLAALDSTVPADISLAETLGTVCGDCGEPVNFDEARDREQRWQHDTQSDCDRVQPRSKSNTALFEWLAPYEEVERLRLIANR